MENHSSVLRLGRLAKKRSGTGTGDVDADGK